MGSDIVAPHLLEMSLPLKDPDLSASPEWQINSVVKDYSQPHCDLLQIPTSDVLEGGQVEHLESSWTMNH